MGRAIPKNENITDPIMAIITTIARPKLIRLACAVSATARTFDALESVRRLQAGLQSFLSMRRIEARRKNASAFRLRFSQSLASLRQRLSHAIVRSTNACTMLPRATFVGR